MWTGVDARPAAVKNFVADSLERLGVDCIDIHRPARLDPNVPIEETVGAIAVLVKQGYVKHSGLSEVGAETIRRARNRRRAARVRGGNARPRDDDLRIFPALGIRATLYGVYSRGLLTGSAPSSKCDYRKDLPRFTGERGAHNRVASDALRVFAEERSIPSAQVLVAWVLTKQPTLVPIGGARNVSQVTDAIGALTRPLSQDDVHALAGLSPAGAIQDDRYQTEPMRHLDSER